MRFTGLLLVVALAVGGCATPESGLILQAQKDKTVKQLKDNLVNLASANIQARELIEMERLTEKTKYTILKAAAQQQGKLSAGAAIGFMMGYRDGMEKIIDRTNVEREMLGKAKVDYQVYKRLSSEVARYLAKIGRITPEQLKAFGESMTGGEAEEVLSNVVEERKKRLEAKAAARAAEKKRLEEED